MKTNTITKQDVIFSVKDGFENLCKDVGAAVLFTAYVCNMGFVVPVIQGAKVAVGSARDNMKALID